MAEVQAAAEERRTELVAQLDLVVERVEREIRAEAQARRELEEIDIAFVALVLSEA